MGETGAEEAAVVGGLAEGAADGGDAEDGLHRGGLHAALLWLSDGGVSFRVGLLCFAHHSASRICRRIVEVCRSLTAKTCQTSLFFKNARYNICRRT
jgi:hypothetical protein